MDAADEADKIVEFALKIQIENSHKHTVEALATGECLFCGEPLPVGMRWCGVECRDDWEREAWR